MTKTVVFCCIARKYLFRTFGHLTFEFVSDFDIRYSDFNAIVFSPRAKLDYTIPPYRMVFGRKLRDLTIHHIYFSGCSFAKLGIVGNHNHRDTLPMKIFQNFYNFPARSAVQVACWFIRKYHLGFHDGSPRDSYALALPAGKLVGPVCGAGGEPKSFKGGPNTRLTFFGCYTSQDEGQFDVFSGGEARHQMKKLEYKADFVTPRCRLLVITEIRCVHVVKTIEAFVGSIQKAQNVQQGGFARA
jgi:hypothetical protein